MMTLRKLLGRPTCVARDRRKRTLSLQAERLEGRELLSHVHGVTTLAHHVARSKTYIQTNLVSNDTTIVPAARADPNLVNPWGIVASASSPFWISDNGKGVSTLYNGSGTPQPLIVTIPAPGGSTSTAAPTGIVFNGSTDFSVTSGGKTGSSVFIFATEDGTISGWSPTVDATHAILAVDNSASGAVYKGLALGSSSSGNRLFATNFHAGTVDVFDANFKPVTLPSGAFTDSKIPSGFAPFGIRTIGSDILVTFAKQNGAKHDDVAGKGNGFVDLFDSNGTLISRIARKGTLNSPWGLALAPSTFGKFSGDLLVGDFGDGRINAFKIGRRKATFAGQLSGTNRKPLTIDGLWGLSFGNGAQAGPVDTLFFTAGPNGEKDGLFGNLTPSAR
ncbi:MAG: hypothetical protein JWN86_2655 [Planctomycetota bacterium]|nr:hypothetical protein [Planctomycetota bacterium]